MPNKTISDVMFELGLFGDPREQKIDWNVFDLSDLGIDFERVRETVYKTTVEVGLRGWRTRNAEVTDYTGFSVTRNPNYNGDSPTPWHQTLGDKRTKETYSAKNGNFGSWRNSYYDTFAFNQVHPNFRWLTDKFNGAVLRSRCSYAWSKEMNFPYTGGWHVDEKPWFMIRFVVPITTGENWRIEFEDGHHHLELGKAYIWDNSIPHRVAPTEVGNDPRINLIIGFCPWFTFSNGVFTKNDVWGKDIQEIVNKKQFLKER